MGWNQHDCESSPELQRHKEKEKEKTAQTYAEGHWWKQRSWQKLGQLTKKGLLIQRNTMPFSTIALSNTHTHTRKVLTHGVQYVWGAGLIRGCSQLSLPHSSQRRSHSVAYPQGQISMESLLLLSESTMRRDDEPWVEIREKLISVIVLSTSNI